jgi:hypothetical protein
MTEITTIFVPVALTQLQAEALISAAHVVIQSAMLAKQTDTLEYATLKEAYQALADSRDRELMKYALANGGSVGEVMLERLQRQLGTDKYID